MDSETDSAADNQGSGVNRAIVQANRSYRMQVLVDALVALPAAYHDFAETGRQAWQAEVALHEAMRRELDVVEQYIPAVVRVRDAERAALWGDIGSRPEEAGEEPSGSAGAGGHR